MESEVTDCGLTLNSIQSLETLGYPREVVYASFLFLYTGGRYNTVSELMTAKYGRGWSLRSCETKIPEFYKAMSKNLRPYITWNNDRVAHATNNTSGLLTPDPSITFDTVPLYVDAWPRCFQPKYSEYVVKLRTIIDKGTAGLLLLEP